ncbi:hypothetical protein L6452_08049 [Arctium lappa]|uniref:Uncharacterized protein n=1 Tax=Arctium lappa TaxID=4217 RepID=A0ACB9DH99_ARCLA|nr:hypothetical protein L6452_08049 [Arctium lappa]
MTSNRKTNKLPKYNTPFCVYPGETVLFHVRAMVYGTLDICAKRIRRRWVEMMLLLMLFKKINEWMDEVHAPIAAIMSSFSKVARLFVAVIASINIVAK